MASGVCLVVGSVLCVTLLAGCCSGGGSASDCRATMTYKGVTQPGTGVDKQKAREGACWGYCGRSDPTVEAAYQKWKAGGGASKGDKFYDLDTVPSLKSVWLECQAVCGRDVAAGKATVTYASNCR